MLGNRLVRDVISGQRVYSVTEDTTVRAACLVMKDGSVGALIVTKNGRLEGIFTERDAVHRVLADGLDPETVPVSKVMSLGVITVTADIPLTRVLHLMHENGFRHVPVVDRLGAPIGMVSVRDALGDELVRFQVELENQQSITEVVR